MSFLSVQAFSTRLCRLAVATLAGTLVLWSSTPGFICATHAQSTPPIISSGLNTQVSTPTNVGGKVQYDITGGTRPGNGPNLFHSFGEFGVPNNNLANFLNDSGRATSNILGRVTGGNPSNIFGTIQTTGFGSANLFLMNPAGILFGPNATLNVGGSVHFTTADYLRLTDGARFTAVPGSQDALLSTAPVAAFGFLGSSPAAISVQGGALSVPAGESISLVGGNISIQAGMLEDGTSQAAQLSVAGGQIRLASVASPGEILYPTLETASNIDGQTFSSMGTITLSENATIDVSGDAGGTVLIRGGQLVIADATISANTGSTNGASPAVEINVTGDFSISDTRGAPAIVAITTAAGDAGDVRIASANFQATSTTISDESFALIDTHSTDIGKAGATTIMTGNLQVTGSFNGATLFIDTGPQAAGRGGDVTINAQNIQLEQTAISTGTQIAEILGLEASGPAGNLTLTADSLRLDSAQLLANAATVLADTQLAGNITINVADINMLNSQVFASGAARGGAITINGDRVIVNHTILGSDTVTVPGGGITVHARVVELTDGSAFISDTSGDGKAGDIQVTGSDHVSLLGATGSNIFGESRPSGLFSNSLGFLGTQGESGNIVVTTPRLEMNQGRINTSTATSGRGGSVTINAGAISIAGEFPNPDFVVEPVFSITDIHPSGIFTKTVGSNLCSGPCGDAGSISINTDMLVMGSGAAIDSGTSSTGRGGEITINSTGVISISGTVSDGTPSGIFSRTVDPAIGAGGKIDLKANQVALSDGASVSAESTGIGPAGSISIEAADSFISRNSSVNTSTTQSPGGNINIKAGNLVQLVDSQITTNVQGGAGNSGNITIDPPTVILEHSNIIASAIGGNGGNINIVAGVFLVSPDSVIDASSTFGVSGTITIESPITNLSGTLAPLPQGFVQPAAFPGRCAARMQGGQMSSLVVRTSRDRIPAEPGELLLSPLFASTQGASVARRSNDLDALRAGLTGFPVPGGCPS